MRIDHREQETARELKRLNNQERDKIAAMQAQTQALTAHYDKTVNDMKLEGAKRVVQTREQNQENELEALDIHQKKLEGYKTNLKETKDLLSREENILKNSHLKKFDSLNELYKNKFETKQQEADQAAEKIDDQTRNFITKINSDSRREINALSIQRGKDVAESARANDKKVIDQERAFEARLLNQGKEHHQTEESAKLQHAKNMQTLYLQQQSREKLEESKHAVGLNQLKSHHAALIKQETESFKNKFQNLVASHEELMSALNAKTTKEIIDLKESSAKSKELFNEMTADPFYNINEIHPEIKDTVDSYTISIAIPAHEQEGVHFTGRERTLRLSLSRRFQDEKRDPASGSVDKSKRTEVITKELHVPEIVNHKAITSQYADGVLSFKILKL